MKKEKIMNTEIIKNTTPSELTSFGDSWDWGVQPDAQDIQIPKLWLMQPLSELVTNGKAKSGDIVNSLEGTVLSTTGTTLEVVVFGSYKTVTTFVDDKYEKTEPFTAELGSLPYEEILQGKKVKRSHALNFYTLLTSEIATDVAFPYVVTFKGTSMNAGRKLMTLIAKLRAFKQPSCAKTFMLGRVLEKNDKGSYYVWTVDAGNKASMEQACAAKLWSDQLKTKTARVDETID